MEKRLKKNFDGGEQNDGFEILRLVLLSDNAPAVVK